VSEYRIGEAAARADVTTRTLRYYEELGLLPPPRRTKGGARRYSEDDVEAVARIRELKDVMGLDLDAIRRIVGTEHRLRALREEFHERADDERRRQIVREAIELNDRLRTDLRARLDRMGRILRDLDDKADRYRARLAEIDGVPAGSG
jgi:MerR family transcriptional regulator, repressor of the yfmOP operon